MKKVAALLFQFLLLPATCFPAAAQGLDVPFVVIDAASGQPIPSAQVRIFDGLAPQGTNAARFSNGLAPH
jgi:hypothetical protein